MKRKPPRRKPPAKKVAAAKKKGIQPIPAGYRSVTAYLSVRGAAQAIEFYKQAFDAIEDMRLPGPGGSVGHAEISIGDSIVMLCDEFAPLDFLSPAARGGTTVHIHLYVKDVDATVARAVAAGANLKVPVADLFYGDRRGTLEDPFGHIWHVATHVEEPSKDEVMRRLRKLAEQAQG